MNQPLSGAAPRSDRWVALGLGLAFLSLYAFTRASVWELPTVFAIDGAELAIASNVLGIDHPPGHPLYLILGYVLTRFFASPDAGTIAVSVLAGALTVPLVFLGALELTRRRWPALTAAVSIGLAGIFWLHSTIIEVYTVQLCMMALLTWLELRALRLRRPETLPAVLFAFGLTTTSNLLLSVLLVPGLAICLAGAGLWDGSASERRRRLVKCLGGLLLGLLPLLYIPWRLAADNRFINDLVYISGYPVPSLIWYAWYLSGWEFVGQKVVAYGATDYPRLIGQYLAAFGRNLTPLALLALPLASWMVVAPAWRIARASKLDPAPAPKKRRRQAKPVPLRTRWSNALLKETQSPNGIAFIGGAVVLVGFLATAAPVIGYQVPDREVFYLPSFLFAAYLTALGIAWIEQRLGARGRWLAPLCLAAAVAWSLPIGWKFVTSITSDTTLYQKRLQSFLQLPKHAVVIGYDDGIASRYRYFQLLHGLRPDVAIETFARLSPRYRGEIPVEETGLEDSEVRAGLDMAERIAALDKLAARYAGRPLFLTLRDEIPSEFPTYRISRAPFDSRLLLLQKKEDVSRSAQSILSTVTSTSEHYPGRLRFAGWGLKGLDKRGTTAFPQALTLGNAAINGIILRGELFEFSFVTQRLADDKGEYFALFSLLDARGQPIASAENGFVASHQQQVMDSQTPVRHYRRDAFDFKIPQTCLPGPATLAVKLFKASDEVAGYYRGRPIRKMSPVDPPSAWNGQMEYIPLGTVLVQ